MIYCITGDMEFFYQEFQFPRPNTANPCLWCASTQEGKDCWNDFREKAGWRRTTLRPGQRKPGWSTRFSRSKASMLRL